MSIRTVTLHSSRKTNIRTLVIANLISGLIYGFYNVLLQPLIVQTIEATGRYANPEEVLGIVMTIGSVMYILPMVFAAKVSDKIGRKRVFLGGFLFFIIAMVLFGLTGNVSTKYPISSLSVSAKLPISVNFLHGLQTNGFPVTYALFLAILGLSIVSLGSGFSDPPVQALTAESSERKKRASSFSIINLAFYATGLVGPLVIRILTDRIEIWVYFYILAILRAIMFIYQLVYLNEPLVIKDFVPNVYQQFIQSVKAIGAMFKQLFVSIFLYLAIPYYLITKRRNKDDRGKVYSEIETNMRLFGQIFRNPGVPYAIGFFILDALTWGLSISIFWGSLVIEYNFNEGHISTLQLVFNLSTLIFFIPVTKYSDRLKKTEMLVLSLVTGFLFFSMNIIAFFALPQYRLYIIMIGWLGMGASVAFWVPGIQSILTDFDRKRRAEVYGMVSGLHQLGWFPTAIIAGYIISRFGFVTVFIISTILFPFNLWMAWKFPTREDEGE